MLLRDYLTGDKALPIANVPNRTRLLRTHGDKEVLHVFSTKTKDLKFPFEYWASATGEIRIFELDNAMVGYNVDEQKIVKISRQQFGKANPNIIAPRPLGRPRNDGALPPQPLIMTVNEIVERGAGKVSENKVRSFVKDRPVVGLDDARRKMYSLRPAELDTLLQAAA